MNDAKRGELALNKNYDLFTDKVSNSDRKKLLKEREDLIEKSINDIQESFIIIGKALLEIRDMKLYKEDSVYNTWSSYLENRVKAKLNQSTIGDYISIVRMIVSNEEIKEDDIIKLGYKKAKLLKTKYNTIMKEQNQELKNKKLNKFKQVYKEIVDSSENIPYKNYVKMFDFVKPHTSTTDSNIVKKQIHGVNVTYNKTKKRITIKSEQKERLDSIFDIITEKDFKDTPYFEKLVTISNNLAGFIREVPKTEIHLHIEAIISVESVLELIKKNGLRDELNLYSLEDVRNRFNCTNLEEMVKVFYLIQSCFKNESDFAYLVRDVRNYLLRNNIYYAEVYFSPTKFIKNGLSFKKIINIIDTEIKRYYVEDKIDIKLIIDVSRNFGLDNAMNNLNLVLETNADSIIGIGLGGAENLPGAEAGNFAPVFKKAKENGLHRVAHAGEVVGPESIWDAINILEVERIGHGISAIYDEKLMDYLKDKQIPLEVCPTSNVFTQKYVTTLGEHPIKQLYEAGIMVTLNSDDPSVFSVDIVDEYENIYEHCGFSISQIIDIVKNGLYSTFLSDNFKKVYWEGIKEKIKFLKEKYNIR
ncbi:MAG: adenosine deaminase [Spirochaetota bacterium]